MQTALSEPSFCVISVKALNKTFVQYGDNEYSEYVRLNKRQVNKIIKYMSKHNEYGMYNNTIAQLSTCKENNIAVYFIADW